MFSPSLHSHDISHAYITTTVSPYLYSHEQQWVNEKWYLVTSFISALNNFGGDFLPIYPQYLHSFHVHLLAFERQHRWVPFCSFLFLSLNILYQSNQHTARERERKRKMRRKKSIIFTVYLQMAKFSSQRTIRCTARPISISIQIGISIIMHTIENDWRIREWISRQKTPDHLQKKKRKIDKRTETCVTLCVRFPNSSC